MSIKQLKSVRRKPGRPVRAESSGAPASLLSREAILEKAVEMTREEPLSELSMVGLARVFGVAPTLIHYYIGSRDDLVSGVVNRYYRERLARVPPLSGDWRADCEGAARKSYEVALDHGGVLRYITSHNRFRLFQKTAPGEKDYGLALFDHFARIFKTGGFTSEQGALAYHLLMQFVATSALAAVGHQHPAEHREFVFGQLKAASPVTHPGAQYLASSFSRIDAKTAFEAGLALHIEGFASWLEGRIDRELGRRVSSFPSRARSKR